MRLLPIRMPRFIGHESGDGIVAERAFLNHTGAPDDAGRMADRGVEQSREVEAGIGRTVGEGQGGTMKNALTSGG